MNTLKNWSRKIVELLKKNQFVIDYSDHSKENIQTYKEVFSNYDEIISFWSFASFEDFKKKYWKSKNITRNVKKQNDFFWKLFQDVLCWTTHLEDWNNTIYNDMFLWSWFDKTSTLTFFSRKQVNDDFQSVINKLENTENKDTIYEDLIYFFNLKFSNILTNNKIVPLSSAIWNHYNFYLEYAIQYLIKIFSSNTNFWWKEETILQVRKIFLNKNIEHEMFTDNFINLIGSWISQNLWEMLKKLKVWKLYEQKTWISFKWEENFEVFFQVLDYYFLLKTILEKYLVTSLYNTLLSSISQKVINGSEMIANKDVLHTLLHNANLYLVHSLLQLDEHSNLATFIFNEDYLHTLFSEKDEYLKNTKNITINEYDYEDEFTTFMNVFWKWLQQYNKEFFKYCCFNTKLSFFEQQLDFNWKKHRIDFLWMYQKNKRNIWLQEQQFVIQKQIYKSLFSYLWKEFDDFIQWKQTSKKYFLSIDWYFQAIYNLIWWYLSQKSYLNESEKDTILFCDHWLQNSVLEHVVFENNKLFVWEQEQIFNTILEDIVWSGLFENLNELSLYQSNKNKENVLRWNSRNHFKTKKDFDTWFKQLLYKLWTFEFYLERSKKYSILITWENKLDDKKKEKILSSFLWNNESFNNISKKEFSYLQKKIEQILKLLSTTIYDKLKVLTKNFEEWQSEEWQSELFRLQSKKILIFNESSKLMVSSYLLEEYLLWSLSNETCDFLYTKYCFHWIQKTQKYWKKISNNDHFLWLPLFSTKKQEIVKNKKHSFNDIPWFCKKEKENILHVQDAIYEDIKKYWIWAYEQLLLPWLTWYAYSWYSYIQLLYNVWYLSRLWTKSYSDILSITKESIINTWNTNEYDDFFKKINTSYDTIYYNETVTQDILNIYWNKEDLLKQEIVKLTYNHFINTANKTDRLQDWTIEKNYFRYKQECDDIVYSKLSQFWWISYIKNALTSCIEKDKHSEWKKVYYLILNDFFQIDNKYYWEDYLVEEYNNNKSIKNNISFIKMSIIFDELYAFWKKNNIHFIDILSQDAHMITDWIVVYYWTQLEFLSNFKQEKLNWVILYNMVLWYWWSYLSDSKSKDKLKRNYYDYMYFHLLHNIIKWWIQKNENFHMYQIRSENCIKNDIFMNWIDNNKIEVCEIENDTSKNIINTVTKTYQYENIIMRLVEEFVNKLFSDISVCFFTESKTNNLFEQFENLVFQKEYSIILNKINDILDLEKQNEKESCWWNIWN